MCPTDCLESIINHTFKHDNFFYTSLGNSFLADKETLEGIKKLIKKHRIRKIYFILSKDNKIILDALGKQLFSEFNGLKTFYGEITRLKEHSELLQVDDLQFSVLSYYLNSKIKKLRLELSNLINYPIEINTQIYDKDAHIFMCIYSNLICVEKYYLN